MSRLTLAALLVGAFSIYKTTDFSLTSNVKDDGTVEILVKQTGKEAEVGYFSVVDNTLTTLAYENGGEDPISGSDEHEKTSAEGEPDPTSAAGTDE